MNFYAILETCAIIASYKIMNLLYGMVYYLQESLDYFFLEPFWSVHNFFTEEKKLTAFSFCCSSALRLGGRRFLFRLLSKPRRNHLHLVSSLSHFLESSSWGRSCCSIQ